MKKIHFAFYLFFLCTSAFAQLNPTCFNVASNANTQSVGSNPHSLCSGDFNGDGKKDLAVANFGANSIGIYLGNNNGTYSNLVTYALGPNPISVISQDFNGDAKLDLAIAFYGSTIVGVLFGSGSGTFSGPNYYSVGGAPRYVETSDLNSDGKPDLLVANAGSNNISVLFGSSSGTFAAAVNYAVGSYPSGISVADINADGWPDVAVANVNTNNVSILLGSSTGTLSSAVNFAVGSSPYSLCNNDFNNDGKKDFAVANRVSNSISILLGTGTGSFVTSTYPIYSAEPFSIVSSDFDLDGKFDLALVGINSSSALFLKGFGNGAFNQGISFPVGSQPSCIISSDMNNDSKPDLVLTNFASNSIHTLFGYGNGVFTSAGNYPTGFNPFAVTSADFNNDGKQDIASANLSSNSVSCFFGTGVGTFSTSTSVAVGTAPRSLVSADFNLDGNSDLAVANANGNNVSVLLGNGSGSFGSPSTFTVGNSPRTICANDFNGDGIPDLALANNVSNNISVLLGSGNGSFSLTLSIAAASGPQGITSADFNNDGKVDLATGNMGSNNVSILLGNGAGSFSISSSLTAGSTPHFVLAKDLNNDGKQDLVVVNYSSNNISVLMGSGTGTFATAVNYAVGGSPQSVTSGDFNSDGLMDLAVSNGNTNNVYVLAGNGTGSFTTSSILPVGINGISVHSADFNSDGKADLVTANYISNSISVLMNAIPALSILSSNSVCAGTSVGLLVTGALTYTWSTSSNTSTIAVTPSVTSVYSVSGTGFLGCSANTSKTIAVLSVPVLSVNSGSVCAGSSFTISPLGASSYTFSSGSSVVSPSINSSYSVTGTGTSGCVSSPIISSVAVNPTPTVLINNGVICAGGTFTLLPSGANTYTFSSGTSIISPTATGSYTTIGASNEGCVSTPVVSHVTVNPLPSIVVNNGTICAGSSFTILPSGASTFTITGGAAIVSPSTTSSYSVTGTSTAGCVSSSPGIVSIVVNPIPTVVVNSGTICNGTSFTLNPTGATSYTFSSGSSILSPSISSSYSVIGSNSLGCISLPAVSAVSVLATPTLSIPGGTLCSGQSFTLNPSGASNYTFSGGSSVVSPSSTSTFSVTGTNSLGCISTTPAIVTVSVFALPALSVNNGTVCNGQSFTINPLGALTYTISGGSSIVSPTATSQYTIHGTSAQGCIASLPAIATITVNQVPQINTNNGSICSGQSFTITPTGASSYTFSGGSAIVNPTLTNTYSVIGTSSAGCLSTIAAVSIVTVNPLPVLTVNSGSICAGQSFSMLPSGATSYTFSGGSSFVSPGVTTSYSITGTSSLGCLSSSPAISTVIVVPLPTVSASSGSICSGQSFTISPTGANTYSFSGGSSVISPTSTTSYSVWGANNNGCTSAIPLSITVSVNPLPTLSANNGTVCIGQSFTLVPNGAATYTFSGGGPVITPTVNSTYTISGTSTAGCLAPSPAIASVIVYTVPNISVNSGTLCSGQTFTLNPNGALTYSYSGGSAQVSPTINTTYSVSGTNALGCTSTISAIANLTVLSTPTITINSGSICAGQTFTLLPSGANSYTISGTTGTLVSPITNTTYTVSGTDLNGCVSALPGIASVSVNPLPIISVNSGSICAGQSYTLLPGGAATYSFSGTTSTVVSPGSNTTYTVSGVSAFGCASAASAISTVVVQPLPVITVGSGSICSGQSYTLSPSGAATYTITGGSLVVSPSSTSSYSVNGTSAAGCISALAAVANVTVYTTPTIAVANGTICINESFTIQPYGATSYSISGGNAVISPTITSSYSITGSSAEGCIANNIAICTVTVYMKPNIQIVGNNSTICLGESEVLFVVASGANSFTWSTGSNSNSITVTPTATTTYSVSGSSTEGCIAKTLSGIIVEPCTDILVTAKSLETLKVYPNPSSTYFKIESPTKKEILVLNALGQIVYEGMIEPGLSEISLREFDNGVYLMLVKEGPHYSRIKLIKQD